MKIADRLIIIETKLRYIEKAMYGTLVLVFANLGYDVSPAVFNFAVDIFLKLKGGS